MLREAVEPALVAAVRGATAAAGGGASASAGGFLAARDPVVQSRTEGGKQIPCFMLVGFVLEEHCRAAALAVPLPRLPAPWPTDASPPEVLDGWLPDHQTAFLHGVPQWWRLLLLPGLCRSGGRWCFALSVPALLPVSCSLPTLSCFPAPALLIGCPLTSFP